MGLLMVLKAIKYWIWKQQGKKPGYHKSNDIEMALPSRMLGVSGVPFMYRDAIGKDLWMDEFAGRLETQAEADNDNVGIIKTFIVLGRPRSGRFERWLPPLLPHITLM
jgi:hypothetical protein